jgi:hypothetical protein
VIAIVLSQTRGAAVPRRGARAVEQHPENLLPEHGPEARVVSRDAGAVVRATAPHPTAATVKTLSAL